MIRDPAVRALAEASLEDLSLVARVGIVVSSSNRGRKRHGSMGTLENILMQGGVGTMANDILVGRTREAAIIRKIS
jgi:hypothetical protein